MVSVSISHTRYTLKDSNMYTTSSNLHKSGISGGSDCSKLSSPCDCNVHMTAALRDDKRHLEISKDLLIIQCARRLCHYFTFCGKRAQLRTFHSLGSPSVVSHPVPAAVAVHLAGPFFPL